MSDDVFRERVIAIACAAFQALACLATVGLLFAFPPPNRSLAVFLLSTTQLCLLITFLNTTVLGAAGSDPRVVGLCKRVLWVPGVAMAAMAAYCIILWRN